MTLESNDISTAICGVRHGTREQDASASTWRETIANVAGDLLDSSWDSTTMISWPGPGLQLGPAAHARL